MYVYMLCTHARLVLPKVPHNMYLPLDLYTLYHVHVMCTTRTFVTLNVKTEKCHAMTCSKHSPTT